MHFQIITYFLLIVVAFSSVIDAYKILVLAPFPAPSHWLWLDHFVRELLQRGHEVTAITNFAAKEKHSNYTEIIIDPPYDMPYYFPISDIFESKYNSDLQNLFLYWNVGMTTTKHALDQPNVQQLIERDDLDFDLVISEQFYQESFLMFAHKYRAPIVTIGTLGYSDFMDRNMGLLTPWSFVPHPVLLFLDDMTFSQRCYNLLISLMDVIFRKYYYLPYQDEMAKKYFAILGSPDTLPSVLDLEKAISVMLINNHISTSPARPSISGFVNVAGAHIKPAKPLPIDMQEFLDDANEGAIFFSLGSYVKSSDMPKDKIKAFLEVFRNLKQKVLWKFEDEALTHIPSNVMIRQWIPQSDVLAHKNIILFITHGGMFGSQEGIYRGVPMLFIPFYGDQHRNALRAEKSGYALTLNFQDVNTITLGSKINELLADPGYMKQAKKASDLFRDNPVAPMDEAMFWIEYVIRHKGAKHLKASSVNLSWYEYLMLDVVFFFTIIVLVLAALVYKLIGMMSNKTSVEKDKDSAKIKIIKLNVNKPKNSKKTKLI